LAIGTGPEQVLAGIASTVRELLKKVYPTVERFPKSATAAIGICSSIGDLLLDALFIIVMDLGGYKEVSGRPAMPATETSFQFSHFCLLAVPLDLKCMRHE
jgi:hypothetical protein